MALGLTRFKSFTFVPYRVVGPTDLPDFYMPYQFRTNPHLDPARTRLVCWAREMGFLDSLPGLPEIGVWDERMLVGFDFAHCAAMINPDAPAEELDVASGWLTWGTYVDDFVPRAYGQRRDVSGVKAFAARLSLFMPLDAVSMPPPLTPAERGLADLWVRTATPMSMDARRIFRQAVEAMTDSWAWELANEAQNRVPDPVDYVEMRRKTFGAELTVAMARLITPRRPARGRVPRPGRCATSRTRPWTTACFVNDVFSYQKEVEFEGELHNMVVVIENFLDVDRRRAVGVVNDLMSARMRQFERIVGRGAACPLRRLRPRPGDRQRRLRLRRSAPELDGRRPGMASADHPLRAVTPALPAGPRAGPRRRERPGDVRRPDRQPARSPSRTLGTMTGS